MTAKITYLSVRALKRLRFDMKAEKTVAATRSVWMLPAGLSIVWTDITATTAG